MLTVLILLVFAAIALVLLLLAVVVVAIWSEPPHERLSSQAPNALSAVVRRLLGVYLRRPAESSTSRAACLAGHTIGRDAEGTDAAATRRRACRRSI
jgi:hypothetical protein